LRTKRSSAIAASTLARVAGLTRSGRLSTLDTVPRETPAAAATSFMPAALASAPGSLTTIETPSLKRNIIANELVKMPFGHAFADALTSRSGA